MERELARQVAHCRIRRAEMAPGEDADAAVALAARHGADAGGGAQPGNIARAFEAGARHLDANHVHIAVADLAPDLAEVAAALVTEYRYGALRPHRAARGAVAGRTGLLRPGNAETGAARQHFQRAMPVICLVAIDIEGRVGQGPPHRLEHGAILLLRHSHLQLEGGNAIRFADTERTLHRCLRLR